MRYLFFLLIFAATGLHAQQFTWNQLPDHMYADSAHAPFILGVASAEPDTDGVYIWTYIEPDSFTQANIWAYYEVATDSNLANILQTDSMQVDSNSSWTVHVHLTGLNPNTYYWYRFNDGRGHYSVTGRTRTLPTSADELNIIVSSCSNFSSGYYNSYLHMAARNDISLILHLGDWAYDKANQTRAIRLSDPAPVNLECELEQRRMRDYLYLLDPDLRLVRQMHPFVYIWDNHDVQGNVSDSLKNYCYQAFREFTGMPQYDSTDASRLYRKISLGPLVDIFMVDVHQTEGARDSLAPDEESFLGLTQYNWLVTQLQNSTATWKLVGQQKMFTQMSVSGLETVLPNGFNPDEKSWESYSLERSNILNFIDSNHIDNVMVLSGDSHFSIVSDLMPDPFDSTKYDPATGAGSVAVEFMPSAISSPNIDERGVSMNLSPVLTAIDLNLNPHHRFAEFMLNGYGILNLKPDSVIATIWLSDVKTVGTAEFLASTLVEMNGDNHWKRTPLTGVATPGKLLNNFSTYPNPTSEAVTMSLVSNQPQTIQYHLANINGQIVQHGTWQVTDGSNIKVLYLDKLAEGLYFLQISGEGIATARPVTVLR